MKRKWICLLVVFYWLQVKAQSTPIPDDGFNYKFQGTVTSYREVPMGDSITYLIQFVYDPTIAMVPATYPSGQPHYYATITVFRRVNHRIKSDTSYKETIRINGYKHKWCQIGTSFGGTFTHYGCFEDRNEDIIEEAYKNSNKPVEPVKQLPNSTPGASIYPDTIKFNIDTATTFLRFGTNCDSVFSIMDTAKAVIELLSIDSTYNTLTVDKNGKTKILPRVEFNPYFVYGYIVYDFYGEAVIFLDEHKERLTNIVLNFKKKNW